MTLGDRMRALFLGSLPPTKSSVAMAATERSAQSSYIAAGSGGSIPQTRPGVRSLRHFSEKNVWVRVAINRRKREIGKAKWSLYRLDNPKLPPDPKLEARVNEMFRFVNTKRESLRSLLDMLVEDILVMDAGVIEKVKTAGGDIAELRIVDGGTIAPNPKWDGSNPKQPRYFQIINGKIMAQFTNDELIYVMQNPRSNSVVGLSPLEVLFDVVEAELYGQSFEYRLLRETAPSGILFLGSGVPPDKVEAFRNQWENEISGTRDIAFIGGGVDPEGKAAGGEPKFTPFGRSSREEARREYMKWLATKVAAAFEMDLLAFNLSETITKANGGTLQSKTDDGLIGLATVIAEYITREIIWEMDPTHKHGFQFMDLTPRDALNVAKVRQLEMSIGMWTPNELRAQDGVDPYPNSVGDPDHWANLPYPFQNNLALPPEEDPLAGGGEAAPSKGGGKSDDDEDD